MQDVKGAVRPKKKSFGPVIAPLWVAVILLFALFMLFAFTTLRGGASATSGDSYIDEAKYQAVYLGTGQIFFGDITEINDQFVVLDSVYYLQVDGSGQQASGEEAEQSEQGSAISLTKRGCEIFAPEERMVIDRSELAYFENIQADGDVAKGIDSWKKDNPDGLSCT